ncbi:murein hydrolase activator EnvC family protein [Microbacterium dauci]|uniref:M23 family metallopeptidase n=1 Tax=Microbacterium dauci TaxID=3048008 RepID=A0ABT6ZBW0_9MICO|nr:M23 family metallopeptidase [Microbacterium sp. LX3-4]MDJ1113645.1 M23 family metallopeptidase [Microbacterium sp. LX3-4]
MSRRRALLAITIAALVLLLPVPAAVATGGMTSIDHGPAGWRLPMPDAVVLAPFVAPAHQYGAGHRGVDIAAGSSATDVLAASAGTVAFAGPVAGRGVLTLDHDAGWVTSVEPVDPSVSVGDVVDAGEPIGTLGVGGHAPPGALHVGVRHHGEYVNPLSLVREVPAAVLLPCCE